MAEFTASVIVTITIALVVGFAPEAPTASVTVAESVPSATPVSLSPAVTIVGADDDQALRVDEAFDRFRSAGLGLPDLEMRFSDDGADCKGHYGLFQPQHDPWRVTVCSELPWVITHELAHAWEAANVTDVQRDDYLADHGFPSWNDPETPWKDRAMEDAAVVIQQNLMATAVNLDSERWQRRLDAFEALTGSASPLLD